MDELKGIVLNVSIVFILIMFFIAIMGRFNETSGGNTVNIGSDSNIQTVYNSTGLYYADYDARGLQVTCSDLNVYRTG